MTERDEKGRFVSQGPDDGFDGEEAKETALKSSWENKRERILKNRYPNLWEEYKDK